MGTPDGHELRQASHRSNTCSKGSSIQWHSTTLYIDLTIKNFPNNERRSRFYHEMERSQVSIGARIANDEE
jgi:hypothetical protein